MNYSNSQRAGVILYLTASLFGGYFSLWLLEQFTNICEQNICKLKADQVTYILCKIAKEGVDYRRGVNEFVSTNFQMIVAGVNHEEIMALYNFGVPTNFEIKEYIPTVKSFVYSILSPGTKSIDSIFEKVIADYPDMQFGDYINLLFFKASDMDDSINMNFIFRYFKVFNNDYISLSKSRRNRINTKFITVFSALPFISVYRIALAITRVNKGKNKGHKKQ